LGSRLSSFHCTSNSFFLGCLCETTRLICRQCKFHQRTAVCPRGCITEIHFLHIHANVNTGQLLQCLQFAHPIIVPRIAALISLVYLHSAGHLCHLHPGTKHSHCFSCNPRIQDKRGRRGGPSRSDDKLTAPNSRQIVPALEGALCHRENSTPCYSQTPW